MALRYVSVFPRVRRRRIKRLVDEDIENALADLTSMEMVLFRFRQFEPSKRQIEQTAILNVRFCGWVRFQFLPRHDLLVF